MEDVCPRTKALPQTLSDFPDLTQSDTEIEFLKKHAPPTLIELFKSNNPLREHPPCMQQSLPKPTLPWPAICPSTEHELPTKQFARKVACEFTMKTCPRLSEPEIIADLSAEKRPRISPPELIESVSAPRFVLTDKDCPQFEGFFTEKDERSRADPAKER